MLRGVSPQRTAAYLSTLRWPRQAPLQSARGGALVFARAPAKISPSHSPRAMKASPPKFLSAETPPRNEGVELVVTLRVDLRPAIASQPLLSLRGNSGAASRWPSEGATSLGRSHPLSRRGAWRGERKVFPCCSGCAPALRLEAGAVATGISRAPWPSAGRRLHRGILSV